ncbi:MAG: hypothetical protein ACRDKY_04715 [Solirubrobacteraceae bacterium]
MRPPLRGKRDAARRLVDGARRAVAEAIAPPQRGDAGEESPEVARDARPAGDIDARFDAARERLRSKVAPREETERGR